MNKPTEALSYQPRRVQELKKLVSFGESGSLEFKHLKRIYSGQWIETLLCIKKISFTGARGCVANHSA